MKKWHLSIIPFLIFTVKTAQAGAPEMLPNIKEAASYSNIDIKGIHTSQEVFRHFSSECAGGKLFFLAAIRGGRFVRLTLLDNSETASYMETDGDKHYPWLLACEGTTRFLVEKEYQYRPGAARFRLYKGRALEGIDYADNRPSALQAQQVNMDDKAFSEKMASELAVYKMSFISTNQGTRFEGRYESGNGSCDTVSVTRLDGGATARFKVCSGTVYPFSGPVALNSGR